VSEETGRLQVGRWQVDPDAGSIADGHETAQVPPRLMHLLQLLADHAGSTVSRESLIEAIWPRGYVNEEALSRAVNELRGLLGDSARSPEFIKTVPKKGYRLIAKTGPANQVPVVAKPGPSRAIRHLIIGGIGVAITLLLIFLWKSPGQEAVIDVLSTAERLTSDPGLEWHPQISSGGQWVAQVVSMDEKAAIQLFPTAAPEQTRFITHDEGLYSPAFSPDADLVATLAGRGDECRILLWPVAASAEIVEESAIDLGSCYRLTALRSLDWSDDGLWLAFPALDPETGANILNRMRVSDGRVFPVTHLADTYQSDQSPRFSPDGKWLSFSRGTRAVRELWIIDLSDPIARPRQLTNDGQFTSGHDWWPDGESIIFDSDRSGHRALWRINLDGEMELLGARDAQVPSVADSGAVLFQVAQYEANIWKLDTVTGQLESGPLIASTKYDSMPRWSPDGSEIAFSSNRTGDGGIWIASSDGSRVRMVYAPDEGRAVGPHWMRDGSALFATEYRSGLQQIVRIALNRREVVVLETPGGHPYAPTQSPDQAWIYYLAGGEIEGSELWRTGADGTVGHELVLEGPLNHYEIGEDGFLYFTRYHEPGLWRQPVEKVGESTLVLSEFPTWAGEDWTIHEGWIYYVLADGIHRFHPDQETVEQVSDVFANSLGPSISVHPDGRSILVSKTDRAETDLFLARQDPDRSD